MGWGAVGAGFPCGARGVCCRVHGAAVCDFVLTCMCQGTLLSHGRADTSLWVGLGHTLPNGGNPTVTGSQAGDYLETPMRLGRIQTAVTKRTIGHWDVLAGGL